MNRFGLEDDSSHESSVSLKVKQTSIQLPSMYSPASNASSKNNNGSSTSSSSHVNNANAKAVVDDSQLPVTDEIKELFTYIDAYQPVDLEIDTPLHCFMPPYVCSVGEPDPMVKIPRPDGVDDGVGTVILDEAIPSKQSNPAVLELQLRNSDRGGGKTNNVVRSVSNVTQHTNEITQWIQSVEEIHAEDHITANKQQPKPEVRCRNKMPDVQELLQAWPKDINEELRNGNLEIPPADIDLNVQEYSKMMCMLLGIPVYDDDSLINSVHVMLNLYVEMQKQNRA